MRQRGYAIAFVLVLLIACAGGVFGGRLLLERLQQDFAPRAGWTPQSEPTAAVGEQQGAPAAPTPTPTLAPRPTATTLVVATPVGVPAVPATPVMPSETATVAANGESSIPAPEATVIDAPTLPALSAFPYALARPVRHTTGDCPGVYVLGQVTDRAGAPLPNIRLRLVDEYGNPAIAVSKGGQADLGRYDFPLAGPPRRFYLTVVDEADRPLSAEVEIRHGLPPDADATCHWADWQRR